LNLELIPSPNTIYTVKDSKNSVTLYKNDRKLYTWDFNFQNISLYGLSNYGKIAAMADGKFYLFEKDGTVSPPVKKLSPVYQIPNTLIENIKIDSRGFYICYEMVTNKKTIRNSEIIIYNINNGKGQIWWEFTKDERQKLGFHWAVSTNFHYIAFLERYYSKSKKDFYNLHLLDVFGDCQLYTVQINEIYSPSLMVNNKGEVILHCKSSNVNRILIFNLRGEKLEVLVPQKFYLYQLGKHLFLLKHEEANQFIFMSSQSYNQTPVDLTLLDKHNISYNVFIKDNDEVALIYKIPGETNFVRQEAPLDSFLIHIKRWQLVLAEQEKQKKESLVQKKKTRVKVDDEKVRKLAESAMKHLNIKKDKISSKVRQIEQLLSKLNNQFIYQELPEMQYKDNREKLMNSFIKLETVAKRLKLDIKKEDFPPDLTEKNILKDEISRLADSRKIDIEVARSWHQKIRIEELKAKEKNVEGEKQKVIQEKEEEIKKVRWLLELLEERFIKGEISEPLFIELRDKYNNKLSNIRVIKSDFFA